MTVSTADLAAFGIEVAVLTACTLALGYALVVHRKQVLYRSGVRWLAASLGLVTAGAILELWGLAVASQTLATVAFVLYTLSSAAITLSMWTFARGFIVVDRTNSDDALHVPPKTTDEQRGFEDAGE